MQNEEHPTPQERWKAIQTLSHAIREQAEALAEEAKTGPLLPLNRATAALDYAEKTEGLAARALQ
jgi:hypothetical protein